jgi:Zn-dependent peptidase ImmA (M78 family)
MLSSGLPLDPMIFTMAHELKHHLVDSNIPLTFCNQNSAAHIEIGAEIFAAELIYPEADFVQHLNDMNIGADECTPEVLVRLKRSTRTTLSYAGLAKRAMFLGFAPQASLLKIQWKKLEEKMFGVPFYLRLHGRRC